MNDKDFDKIFFKKLQEEKHFPVDDKSWETLSSQLDEKDKRKPISGFKNNRLAWLLPFLSLLLGLNVWSLLKMNQTQTQNSLLSNELKTVKTLLQNKDTLNKIQYIYKTDTVFIYPLAPFQKNKTLPSTDKQQNLQFQSLKPTPFPIKSSSYSTPTALYASEKWQNKNGSYPFSESNKGTSTAQIDTAIQNIWTQIGAVQLHQLLEFQPIASLAISKNLITEEKKSMPHIILLNNYISVLPITKTETNNRFYIGTSAGYIYYHTLWRNKDGLEVGRNEKSYQVGLKMEYALTNNWRVTAESAYCPYDFKIYWLDKRYNLPEYPTYFNPTNSTINSIKGTQKLYLSALGIKYTFNQNRWKPYLGAAYSAMRIEPYDAEYTFTHTATGKTYTSTTHLNGGKNIKNVLLFNGGLEYRLSKHLVAQAEGFYYKDANKIAKTFDLYGLRTAILLGF